MTKQKLDDDFINALDVLKSVNKDYSYDEICKITPEILEEYNNLLIEFKKANSSKVSNTVKGKALENIVSYLLKISGNIFTVDRNLHTCTNEIDQMVKLQPLGKLLFSNGLINPKLDLFISECKNHNKVIDVTYVGKFCSLLLTNQIKLGLLFSYHGVSGSNWRYGSGLIKKFYLHKESIKNRYCIIDFSIKDFESISEGSNLLQIIDEKLYSLQFDTDYSKHISAHPAE